jgi:hypothetical protein
MFLIHAHCSVCLTRAAVARRVERAGQADGDGVPGHVPARREAGGSVSRDFWCQCHERPHDRNTTLGSLRETLAPPRD